MPAQNTKKPVQSTTKPVANAKRAAAPMVATKSTPQKPDKKDKLVIAPKSPAKAPADDLKKPTATAVAVEIVAKKNPGRPPQAAAV